MKAMKVIIAVDDSAHSEYALESVTERPWVEGSEFLVLTVLEPFHPDYAGWDTPSIEVAMRYAKDLEERAHKYASHCASVLTGKIPSAKVSYQAIESAKIKETIVQTAIDWNADLIIMGSHGRNGLQRFLLGSVSQAVVAHAPCSVEIIKRASAHSSN